MFGTIRDKFQIVQDGLSASIRGLTLTESSTKPKKIINVRKVNYDAGADILHHFQMEWNNLHELSEENAQKAQEADALITTIHEKLEFQWNCMSALNSSLAEIPKINNTVETLINKIGSLQEKFDELNNAIFELEDLHEVLDFQKNQIDHKLQLALYQEKKLSEFNLIKEKLASEHAAKVLEYEQEQEKILKERQDTFEEAFKEQIKEYKQTGYIPKISSNQHKGPSLDEIVLESDSTDFDEFLKE
ncbi:PREDICTED: dysbindin protein homolog [Ceratosolen solmsi marchali]|uniref:Dysbindin protein homolog n=1 Tax=Ceratosolen solmsi marchali TaxID=326594 RepID=A0AAJ6YPG1_9HYME|nr:PREDICTED: dysbindin protein homolog [Ceratosolen solmsi marchali]